MEIKDILTAHLSITTDDIQGHEQGNDRPCIVLAINRQLSLVQ